jgi:hypothetical protein
LILLQAPQPALELGRNRPESNPAPSSAPSPATVTSIEISPSEFPPNKQGDRFEIWSANPHSVIGSGICRRKRIQRTRQSLSPANSHEPVPLSLLLRSPRSPSPESPLQGVASTLPPATPLSGGAFDYEPITLSSAPVIANLSLCHLAMALSTPALPRGGYRDRFMVPRSASTQENKVTGSCFRPDRSGRLW